MGPIGASAHPIKNIEKSVYSTGIPILPTKLPLEKSEIPTEQTGYLIFMIERANAPNAFIVLNDNAPVEPNNTTNN